MIVRSNRGTHGTIASKKSNICISENLQYINIFVISLVYELPTNVHLWKSLIILDT